jgi:hypothetical protein
MRRFFFSGAGVGAATGVLGAGAAPAAGAPNGGGTEATSWPQFAQNMLFGRNSSSQNWQRADM